MFISTVSQLSIHLFQPPLLSSPYQSRNRPRSRQSIGNPPFCILGPQAEELESLTSHDVNSGSSASSLSTFHHPPMPMPFHADMGSPQSTDPVFAGTQISGSSFYKATNANRMELAFKAEDGTALTSSSELELPHLIGANVSTEEEDEDVCPTCLEDYTAENQKVITKCNHHFHLSCILEWMERSDTCSMCNQEMDFDV